MIKIFNFKIYKGRIYHKKWYIIPSIAFTFDELFMGDFEIQFYFLNKCYTFLINKDKTGE